jgi:nicotinamidase-related amidase
MSHMCIDATTRAAFDYGLRCRVIHDACATRNLVFEGLEVPAAQVHAAFMAALRARYAQVLSVEEFLATFPPGRKAYTNFVLTCNII